MSVSHKMFELRDLEEALLIAIRKGHDGIVPLLIVSGARRLDCALYLAIQLERINSVAMLLLCKATITNDCQSIRSLLNEPPDSDTMPWYMRDVHSYMADMHNTRKMSYPIAVSIMEKNYEATKELLLKTDSDMRRKQVDWSKLKLTLLHPSWMYSIAPWVVSLKLVNNHLRKLPGELVTASQLRRLDLSSNLLPSIQASVFNMPNLEYLNLGHNQLRELPETDKWSPQLLTLDLAKNNLQKLPTGIQHSSIEILSLSENQFTAIPRCLCRIKSLTSLDISHMTISSFPKEMENLDKLVNLNVSNANIKDLPGGGVLPSKIRGFFKARARSSKPCNVVKLVVLCQSDIAKGLMYSRLKSASGSSPNIPDMGVFQWNYRPLLKRLKLYFNTWLLGSSRDYSAIYPCFFSGSALYLIVWDMTRTGELREQIKPYVDLLARYVSKANIIVMVILPEPFEAWADANYENLTKRLNGFFSKSVYRSLQYHGLAMMSTTAAVRDTQIDIKQKIYEIASSMTLNGHLAVGRSYPENYFTLISVIEKEQQLFRTQGKTGILEEKSIWSLFERSLNQDSPNKMELPVIIDFLQDAGLLLHFPDPNDRLDQYYFLRPEWLYYTMLRVLQHALQHSERVTITYADLCSMVGLNWSKSVSKALIRLMVRFAVVLPIKNQQQLLVPRLLPHCNPSSVYLNVGVLRRQFSPKTKGLPSDLWYRIICRVLASLHRITEMKTLKKRNSPFPETSIKEGSKKETSAEKQLDTDEETDDQDLPKEKSDRASVRRGSSTPTIFLSPNPDESSLDTSPISVSSPDSCLLPDNPNLCPDEVVLIAPPINVYSSLPVQKRSNIIEKYEQLTNSQSHDFVYVDDLHVAAAPESERFRETQMISLPSLQTQSKMNGTPSNEPTSQHISGETPQLKTKDDDATTILPQPTSSNIKEPLAPLNAPDAKGLNVRGTLFSQSPTMTSTDGSHVRTKTTVSHASPAQPETRHKVKRVKSVPPKKRTNHYQEPVTVEKGVRVWNSGLIYERRDITFSIYPCSYEMSTVEERGIEICSTKNTKGRIVLARLCKIIQNLLEERYPDLFSVNVPLHKHELTQFAICPICIEKKERNPTNFLVETCVHSLKSSEFYNCRFHPEEVPMHDLVPDYLIVDFPSIYNLNVDAIEFNQARPIHRGVSTALYDGKVRGHALAVKMHTYSDGRTITGPLSKVRQEIEMLFHLKHPNIVRTFGFCLSSPCVLLEKAPLGNLHEKLMDTEQRVSRPIRFHIACQVASALDYLHRKEIIYRTLKASSILVWSLDFSDDVNIKLTNFERAAFKTPSGLIGQPSFAAYHAPEMLRYSFREEYTEKVDIYSFGMLLYELVTRWHPFSSLSAAGQVPASQQPKLLGGVGNGYSTLAKLMHQCWQEQQSERPTALSLARMLSHPAFLCHIATSVLRDCISVRGCCYVPSVHQIWVYGEYNPKLDDSTSGENAEGTQVFIMNAQTLAVQGSLELKERASAIYTIDNKVWIGMTEACVHAYDTTTFQFTDRLHLKDSITSIVDNETFVFVAQANGHLTCYPKLKLPKESRRIEIGSKPIITIVVVGDAVWLGCGNEIVILRADEEHLAIIKRWEVGSPTDQLYTLVLSKDVSTVWSLVRGETSITSWDSNTGNMKNKTDFSQDLLVVCCDLNCDPSYVRMSSMQCVKDTLWVGLTCGAIVVFSASDTPKVITFFQAHHNSTKCLMEIPRFDGRQKDYAMIVSGGFGEVSYLSSPMTEKNGVIMSWQALSATELRYVTNRYNKYYINAQ